MYKGERWQRICVECNCSKGGELDFTHPDIRKYGKELIQYLEDKIYLAEFRDQIKSLQ